MRRRGGTSQTRSRLHPPPDYQRYTLLPQCFPQSNTPVQHTCQCSTTRSTVLNVSARHSNLFHFRTPADLLIDLIFFLKQVLSSVHGLLSVPVQPVHRGAKCPSSTCVQGWCNVQTTVFCFSKGEGHTQSGATGAAELHCRCIQQTSNPSRHGQKTGTILLILPSHPVGLSLHRHVCVNMLLR